MEKNINFIKRQIEHLIFIVIIQLTAITGCMMKAHARDYFNPALLELGMPGQKPVDLSSFENQGGQLPGMYRVDIFLNNRKVDTRDVEFRLIMDNGHQVLQPCISIHELSSWGVLTKKFPELGDKESKCSNFVAIPQASSDFRFAQQQLLLSFPQSAVNNSVRDWVDPKLWDEGITSVLLNYSITGSNNFTKGGQGNDSNSQFINLRPGINIGPWRLRNYTTWNRTSSGGYQGQTEDHWSTIYSYIQRDIIVLKSQFTAGDSSTAADIFDSIPFRGAQLASDDDMLPESLRGYAPVVRGIARSNAQVTIRQNGYVIYQTYVSPGSFEITDMYPTGGAGDLNVTIKESDGSEQLLVIPYASLPVLQREGRMKYSATTGIYRSYNNSVDKTPLGQGTLIYGLPAGYTAYGGVQVSSKYQSFAFGVGKNLGVLGAISADVTQAWAQQKHQDKEKGQSWRVRYSKNFVQTGTNFSMAGYRYATDGYWGMQEVLDSYTHDSYYSLRERRRNRAELSLSQNLGAGAGSLGITATREDYWNTNRSMESYTASYNNSWKGTSYGFNYTYNINSSSSNSGTGRRYNKDQLFAFNISVPLNLLFGESNSTTYLNYMANTSKNGISTNNVSINGTSLEDNNLSWSVQQGYGSKGQGASGSINTDWRATYGEVNGGYSYDKNSERLNYGLQGGMIAHADGITLGQPMGETVVLVSAPGADGVKVMGQTGVKTDIRGYAVVPYASPYRKNDVTLDPQTFNDNTEVAVTTQTVVPTRGSVVKASYQTSVGYRVFMTLLRTDKKTVPFGAIASVSGIHEKQGFIVGDLGQVYLTGLAQHGNITVKWGNGANDQCKVAYTLPKISRAVTNVTSLCE